MTTDLDLNTIQILITAILFVFSILLVMLWIQAKEDNNIGWWCIASLLLTVQAAGDFLPQIDNYVINIYFFNAVIVFSYLSLMIGCLKFLNIKINRCYIPLGMLIYFSVSIYGYYSGFEVNERRFLISIFNILTLTISMVAILKLSNQHYLIEKMFFTILTTGHIFIYIFWIYLIFTGPNQTLFIYSLTPTYIIDAFIIISLLLLLLARVRSKLELEISKSIATKNSLSKAVHNTNVANKSKSIFLTNMSHELRTPLNIILGFSEMLNMSIIGPLNEKQQGFVENIHQGGKRLLNLINDLLSLSNIEAGNLEIRLEEMELSSLIDEHVAQLENIANVYSKNIHIINDMTNDVILSDGSKATVLINNVWISQILGALVDNAAKYGNENGHIWLNYFQCDDDHVRISIKDDGIGINEMQFENVFKPFNRAGYNFKGVDGTGAGLSIVKGLVEAMNATIEFRSELSKGTTFWIDIPLSNINAQKPLKN